jgi:hypothetical protein
VWEEVLGFKGPEQQSVGPARHFGASIVSVGIRGLGFESFQEHLSEVEENENQINMHTTK